MPTEREQTSDERQAASVALTAYLRASNPVAADQCLSELVTAFAMPAIERAARSRLRQHMQARPEDFDDICSDAVVALVTELQSMRDQLEAEPIQDFPAFAATLAHRACSSWSRRTFPAFHGLRNRLRYVLHKDSALTLWQTPERRWICGLVKWEPGRHALDIAPGPLPPPETFDDLASVSHPADILLRIFKRVGHPVEFDELTRVMARLWSVQDARAPIEEDTLTTQAPDFESSADRRQWLQRLWQEIELLLPRQRAALLLNLKDEDGCCATSVFVVTGIVSLEQMGASLDIPALEFAEIWKSMPLDDQTIAGRLGISRQQVINLRKCARERLSRRLSNRESVS
jgi:RNA polymerase sigma factor (sigma-70 family)